MEQEQLYAVRATVMRDVINILKGLPWEQVHGLMPELFQARLVERTGAEEVAGAPERQQ